MGAFSLYELLLMGPGCVVGLAGLVGWVLGVLAFFRVRRLERQIQELRGTSVLSPRV